MDGEYLPVSSTNTIYVDEDTDLCLTVHLEDIEADIAALETGKANTSHTHTQYSLTTHTHTGYAAANHTHTGYAASDHTHSEYALVDHTHTGYAASTHTHNYNDLTDKPTIPTTLPANGGNADTVDGKHASDFADASAVTAIQTLVGDTSVATQISSAVSGKADSVHTHAIADVTGLSSELSAKYVKPSAGVPKTDLAPDVQSSLSKADTALQSYTETDPTVPSWAKASTKPTYTAAEVGALPSTTTLADLSDDSTHRTVTDAEKTSWNAKATTSYVDTKVADLVDAAPTALDTLNELAAALGDDPNFATTIATQIGNKVDKVNGKDLSTNDYTNAEKTKLAGIETGATNTVVDSALSETSTNPVQNKVVSTAITNLTNLVGDTAVSAQISAAINELLHLPTVTTADNGKILKVVNGTWQAVTPVLSVDSNGVVSL